MKRNSQNFHLVIIHHSSFIVCFSSTRVLVSLFWIRCHFLFLIKFYVQRPTHRLYAWSYQKTLMSICSSVYDSTYLRQCYNSGLRQACVYGKLGVSHNNCNCSSVLHLFRHFEHFTFRFAKILEMDVGELLKYQVNIFCACGWFVIQIKLFY